MPRSSKSIENTSRIAAWTALASLFADSEIDDAEMQAIATRLSATRFSADDLEHMARREIAPMFGANLLNPAGEWAGWNEAEIAKIMAATVRSDGSLPLKRRIIGWLAWPLVADSWARLRTLLEDQEL